MGHYDTRIIITTCYNYSQLLKTCLYGIEKHWPDREWPLTIASDKLNYDIKNKTNLNFYLYKQNASWSKILIECLKSVKEEIILLSLDDFILRAKVDSQLLNSLVLHMKLKKEINYLRLVPRPKAKKSNLAVFNEISFNEPYRVSLQASLWRRDILIDLLDSNESPWQFELKGCFRAKPGK